MNPSRIAILAMAALAKTERCFFAMAGEAPGPRPPTPLPAPTGSSASGHQRCIGGASHEGSVCGLRTNSNPRPRRTKHAARSMSIR